MNNNSGENILKDLATGIHHYDPFIKALFYDEQKRHGALADVLQATQVFCDYYSNNQQVQGHSTDSLDLIVQLFTRMERRGTTVMKERDNSYLRRMRAFTVRGRDEVWGTKWNIAHTFQQYFVNSRCFVVEHTDDIKNNLLQAIDFEKEDENEEYLEEIDNWELEGSARFEKNFETTFSQRWGLLIGPGKQTGSAAQNVNVEAGLYTLHFFLRGKAGVFINDSQGNYHNSSNKENLHWTSELYLNEVDSEQGEMDTEWKPICLFIRVPEATTLTINFVDNDEEELVAFDYVRLFHKLKNPSYTIILYYADSNIDENFGHYAAGKADPDEEIIDYKMESYFDHSFIFGLPDSGSASRHGMLFDIFHPVGVQYFVETVHHQLYEEYERK